MEEQRARQEDEARKVAEQSAEEAGVKPAAEGIVTLKCIDEDNKFSLRSNPGRSPWPRPSFIVQ